MQSLPSSYHLRTVAVALVLALVVAAAPAPVDAQEDAAVERQHQQLRQALRSKRVSVSFDETPFPDALEYLSQRAGVNFVVQPTALEDVEDETLTLTLSNVTAGNALRIMLDFVELTWTYRHGVVWVTTPEDSYEGRTVVKLYDVRDLTFRIKDFPGLRIRLRSNDEGGPGIVIWGYEDEPDIDIIDVDILVDVIPEFTGGESWDMNPEACIFEVMGMLLIRQTPEVHDEIAALIANLKSNR